MGLNSVMNLKINWDLIDEVLYWLKIIFIAIPFFIILTICLPFILKPEGEYEPKRTKRHKRSSK